MFDYDRQLIARRVHRDLGLKFGFAKPEDATARRTIQRIVRMAGSRNGNPRFRIVFTDGSEALTMSDASFCYAIGNPGMREGCTVRVEFTRAGRIRHMGA